MWDAEFDVIVVGTGHAGCEAALAAARLGCRTLALTTNLDNVALMACNPSIGGPAKANLVREVDAMGGAMALATDATYLQIRLLNTGKGPAVHALRAQVDKKRYQQWMRRELERQPGLTIRQGTVVRFLTERGAVVGVETKTGLRFRCRAAVLTSGTYLEGRAITGGHAYASGPSGQLPAVGLSAAMRELGIVLGRFKTGTPPRVSGSSIDLRSMKAQCGDSVPRAFSYLSPLIAREQLPCYLTHTNERTHRIIRDNLHRAPLFSGVIEGVGPRYCPSVEDKVVRFADKEQHQVFFEPEGWETDEYYVLGLSTSLPEEVQVEMLRSIPGCEQAEIIRAGYAIEYDYVAPTQLTRELAIRAVPGLFSGGQVNGTSGYEEAAAQGLIAGANAALFALGREPFTVDRSEGYVGVLIDDLVTKGTTEPYRILTSRAEYRLTLRQDTADLRLTERAWRLGLVSEPRFRRMVARREAISREISRLESDVVRPDEETNAYLEALGSVPITSGIKAAQLLRRPEVRFEDLVRMGAAAADLPVDVRESVEVEIKYAGYLEKEQAMVERFRRIESRTIPADLDYGAVRGLATEAREKLSRFRPQTVGQAQRISGVSPADVNALLVHLRGRLGEASPVPDRPGKPA